MGKILREVVTPFRLVLRHWPTLVTLAIAGLLAREMLLRAAVVVAGVHAILGFLVFLLAPLSVMIAMVLMLRTMRPSLGSVSALPPPPSVIAHVGSVLIPFVAFYYAFGLLGEDYRAYSSGLRDRYEDWVVILAGEGSDDVRVDIDRAGHTVWLLAVVAVAFAARWALGRWQLTRSRPLLGLPGAYLETVWITLGLLWVVKPYSDRGLAWAEQRVAWQAAVSWWDGLAAGSLAGLYHTVDDWIVTTLPSGTVTRVFVMPIAGLVAAGVVYGVTLPPTSTPRGGLLRLAGSANAAADRWFGPLTLAVRATARSGLIPVMMFCLAVVALTTGVWWLRLLERLLIGPYERVSLPAALDPSIEAINDVIIFVLLVCVLAAGADRMARRLNPAPAAAPVAAPAAAAAPSGDGEAGERGPAVDGDPDGDRLRVPGQGEERRAEVP